jgi:hypothetical protein
MAIHVTRAKTLERLIRYAPPILERAAKTRARCILATAVGLDVLRAFDIPAAPLAVHVVLANRAYLRALDRGASIAGAIVCGGHVLETAPPDYTDRDANMWAGHLVICTHGALVDLDLQQMQRPQHGLELPAAAQFPWRDGLRAREFPIAGAVIRYEVLDDRTYEQSGDWYLPHRRAPIVGDVCRAIRKGY